VAIRKPYDAGDVFASPEEARRARVTVTEVPLQAFRESVAQDDVRQLVREARRLVACADAELPLSLT
jgi:hypothetical protein